MRLEKTVHQIFDRVDDNDLAGANWLFERALDGARRGKLQPRRRSPRVLVPFGLLLAGALLLLI
jgi:hypothetical protein